MNKKQIVENWLKEINNIPTTIIEKAFNSDPRFTEITVLTTKHKAWIPELKIIVNIANIDYVTKEATVFRSSKKSSFTIEIEKCKGIVKTFLPTW